MMISPEYYRETIKDYTLEQLFMERNELLKEIRRYRRHEISPEEYQKAPSPSVIYKCNLKYLEEVRELINEKWLLKRNKDMIDILSCIFHFVVNNIMYMRKKTNVVFIVCIFQ